jgi:transcriptional regulator with XRE-family HTH domain
VGIIADALDAADRAVVTAPIPKTTAARVRFLVKHHHGSTALTAATLGVSRRSVERYLKGERKKPPTAIAERIATEVTRRWQPQVRARARRRAATTGGITVETRARFGYTAAAGSTDDPRPRRIAQHLSPPYAADLFAAHGTGADEEQLAAILARGLQDHYFRTTAGAAAQLIVTLTDIDYLDLIY